MVRTEGLIDESVHGANRNRIGVNPLRLVLNPLHAMWRRAGAPSIPSSRAGCLRHFAGIALTDITQTEVVTRA